MGETARRFKKRNIAAALLTAVLALVFVLLTTAPSEAKTSVTVKVGSKSFSGVLFDNKTGKALKKKLPLSYKMSELNGNEKYEYLDFSLPTNEKAVKKIKAGDIMLYGDDCLVVFYKSFSTSYEYTRVGRITNPKGLAKAAGSGSVKIKISKKPKIALNKKTLTMQPGKTATLKLSGAKKSKVKWKSSNKKIATVTKSGKVKAKKKKGKVKITATYKKKKYVCKITVKKKAKSQASAAAPKKSGTSSSAGGSSAVGTVAVVDGSGGSSGADSGNSGTGAGSGDVGGGSGDSGSGTGTGGDDPPSVDPVTATLTMYVGGTKLDVEWLENESVEALRKFVKTAPVEITMSGFGDFEQFGPIGSSLPSSDVQMTTSPGDIILYQGNKMVLFYGSNSWSYTKLGSIKNKSTAELTALLSGSNVTVRLVMENNGS